MSTLLEIEAAAEALPPDQQEELLLFLATRLRGASPALPPPREFTRVEMEGWISDDEAGYHRFLAGK
jgi:hypothetical protein